MFSGWKDFNWMVFLFAVLFAQYWMWITEVEETTQRFWRHPARVSVPNPMRSHSVRSCCEFCMTCAAPRDEEWTGRCLQGEAGQPRDILRPQCAFVEVGVDLIIGLFSRLRHWPLCKVCIKNSGPVKTEPPLPSTNPGCWPLVGYLTVRHVKLTLCECLSILTSRALWQKILHCQEPLLLIGPKAEAP